MEWHDHAIKVYARRLHNAIYNANVAFADDVSIPSSEFPSLVDGYLRGDDDLGHFRTMTELMKTHTAAVVAQGERIRAALQALIADQ